MTTLMATEYEASVKLRIMTPSTGGLDYLQRDIDYAVRLMNTFAERVTSDGVLFEVMDRVDLDERPEVQVNILENTELMVVTVTAPSAEQAQQIANEIGTVMVEQSQASGEVPVQVLSVLEEQLAATTADLEAARDGLSRTIARDPNNAQAIAVAQSEVTLQTTIYARLVDQITTAKAVYSPDANQLTIFQEAELPTAPSKPNRMLNIIIGLALGLVAGVSLALLFENIYTRLHSVGQVEVLSGLPVIGTIPKSRRGQIILKSAAQEQAFRRLRHNVLSLQSSSGRNRSNGQYLDEEQPERTLLITSASAHEGKSTVTANLGLALARVGRRVVLIDAHLQRPALNLAFDLPNEIGPSHVLLEDTALEDAIQETSNACLFVMASGPEAASAMELLDLSTMNRVVEQLADSFDYVILDSPALWGDADAVALAPAVEGVLMVIQMGDTREETLRTAIQELETIHARTLGIVANWTNGSNF